MTVKSIKSTSFNLRRILNTPAGIITGKQGSFASLCAVLIKRTEDDPLPLLGTRLNTWITTLHDYTQVMALIFLLHTDINVPMMVVVGSMSVSLVIHN